MAEPRDLSGDEATALLRMVGEYSRALDLLDDYDHQRVPTPRVWSQKRYALTYEEAIGIVDRLQEQFGGSTLFGQEKDDSLHSSLQAIMQTFGGQDRYPSLKEKAAPLIVFPGEKPLLCGWQQAYRSGLISLASGAQQRPDQCHRGAPDFRCRTGGHDPDDRGKPSRRKGRVGAHRHAPPL